MKISFFLIFTLNFFLLSITLISSERMTVSFRKDTNLIFYENQVFIKIDKLKDSNMSGNEIYKQIQSMMIMRGNKQDDKDKMSEKFTNEFELKKETLSELNLSSGTIWFYIVVSISKN